MKVVVTLGDITKIPVDVIVNAANTSLLGGGGVDGAIHRNGGKEILEECRLIRNTKGGCKVGEAVITTAGKLPARYVIHTVGPRWVDGAHNEKERLALCYKNSLSLACSKDNKSISFPSISTGTYRFPLDKAVEVAVNAIIEFSTENSSIKVVNIVCFDENVYNEYCSYMSKILLENIEFCFK